MIARPADSPGKSRQRPSTLTAAVALAVAIQLAGIPFNFVPGSEDAPAFAVIISIVASVLILVGCWSMWNLHKWGAILVLVLTVLTTLAAIPGFFDPPSGWILAAVIILVPLSLIDIVLIALPQTWRSLRAG